MQAAQVAAIAAGVKSKDLAGAEKAGKQIIDDARQGPRAMVELLIKRAAGMTLDVPWLIIPNLEEQAIVPLVELGKKPGPVELGWSVDALADAFLGVRRRVVERLMELLEDLTAIPQASMPGLEAQPIPRRVCDQAYLALRRVVKPEEDPKDGAMEQDAFLSQVESMRNNTIKKFKTSGAFANFVAY